jgi:Flp pilus assembly protein TadG
MRGSARLFWNNTDGAVAPTVALSLFAMIAAGGIAFDYAHMAGLHTELQQAADQAALAAATQLDGNSDSIQRATAAAKSLVTNNALFADSGGRAVTVPTVVFYATAADAEADANPVTVAKSARFVKVLVGGKEAFFALTPVVGAFSSGDIAAAAVAGLKSQICKVPPLMMCNPDETASNLLFDAAAYVGKGIWLVAGGGVGQWAPGDFGYLKNTGGSDPTTTPYLRKLLGWTEIPGDCVDVQVANTKPGLNDTVTKALNTRFDIYDNGGGGDFSCPTGGACPPAFNDVKDVMLPASSSGKTADCTYGNGGNGWQLPDKDYYGSNNFPDVSKAAGPTSPPADAVMGLPRDECHVTIKGGKANQLTVTNNNCADKRVGNGVWDRDAYFKVNYGWDSATWQANTGLPATATRYQVYTWEIAHNLPAPPHTIGSGSKALTSYYSPRAQCPFAFDPSVPERRKLTVAVVDCSADLVKGSTPDVPIRKWIDVFLVEPSIDRERTAKKDVYIEVIGETTVASSKGSGTLRNVPYLIK